MDSENTYSIGYGSCNNPDVPINDDDSENDNHDGEPDGSSMDTTDGLTDSSYRKRVLNLSPGQTISNASKKQTISGRETSGAHFYHKPIEKLPTSSELYNTGKGGARISALVTTCCCG